jgi:hypothetical protein
MTKFWSEVCGGFAGRPNNTWDAACFIGGALLLASPIVLAVALGY